jgi:hypothetical protein
MCNLSGAWSNLSCAVQPENIRRARLYEEGNRQVDDHQA